MKHFFGAWLTNPSTGHWQEQPTPVMGSVIHQGGRFEVFILCDIFFY